MNNLLLNARSLIYHLRQYRAKRRLHYFAETESTNEVADVYKRQDEEIEKEFDGKGYGDFKTAVGEAVCDELRPLREEYNLSLIHI